MGGKSSKEPVVNTRVSQPEPVQKFPRPTETNTETPKQVVVNKSAGATPVERASVEAIKHSMVRTVLELILMSEKLRDITTDDDIILNPLNASKSKNGSVQFMRLFLNAVVAQDKTKQVTEIEAFLEKLGMKDHPVFQVFSCLQTAFKLVRIENQTTSASIKDALLALVNLPYSSIEGTEIEPVIFQGLLQDIQQLKSADYSQDDAESQLNTVKSFVKVAKDADLWPINLRLPEFAYKLDQLLYLPTEELASELEEFLRATRVEVSKSLASKTYDSQVIGPKVFKFGPMSIADFKCLPMLNLGYISFDSNNFFGRSRKIALQVFQEPDKETIRRIEILELVTADGRVLEYDSPLFRSVTVNSMIKKLGEWDSSSVASDFDAVCLFENNGSVYYCLGRTLLQGKGEVYGNSQTLRCNLVRQKDLLESNSYKVVFAPNGVLPGSKNPFYIVAIRKNATLKVLGEKIWAMFSHSLEGIQSNKNALDSILASLVFSDGALDGGFSANANRFNQSAEAVKARGWDTPISGLVQQFGSDNSADFRLEGDNKADLVVSLNRSRFSTPLVVNAFNDSENLKFIVGKPDLSDAVNQFVGEAYRTDPAWFTEERIRELMPNYLYVDTAACASMFALSPDLDFDFLDDRFAELELEFSPKYRAVGFLAEDKKTRTQYTITIDKRTPTKVTALLNGHQMTSELSRLDANSIRGVYYQRCAKDL